MGPGSRRDYGMSVTRSGDRQMARLGRRCAEPAADARKARKVIAALARHMGVGVERDVGDREGVAGQPVGRAEPAFHAPPGPDCRPPATAPCGPRWHRRAARDRRSAPAARQSPAHGVLLEEQPFIGLRPVIGIGRQQRRPFGEMEQDRVQLGEKPAVVQFDRRQLADRVLGKEFRPAGRAVERGDRDRAERPVADRSTPGGPCSSCRNRAADRA